MENNYNLERLEARAECTAVGTLVFIHLLPLIVGIIYDNTLHLGAVASMSDNPSCYRLYQEEIHEEQYIQFKDYCNPLKEIAKHREDGMVDRFSLLERLRKTAEK